MGAARPDVVDRVAGDADHAAAGDADNAHVERVDVGLVPADPRVSDGRPAVADHADVGAGAADLEIDTVRDLEVHEGARHRGGRPGQHGYRRAAAHLLDAHDAAVAAHDHHRRLNTRLTHARLGHVGGCYHPRQDAGVDDGGTRARRQAVELGDLVAAG